MMNIINMFTLNVMITYGYVLLLKKKKKQLKFKSWTRLKNLAIFP